MGLPSTDDADATIRYHEGVMADEDTGIQLDLTESITEVPQANSISLFICLLEALRGEDRSTSTLAALLEVDERTVRYYTDFGRWLNWLRPTGDGRIGLTTDGLAFVESEPARGRLFAHALFRQPLVQTVQQLKREHGDDIAEPEATRRACEQAVHSLTTLSDATAERRAGALASMLRWAYRPGQLDWTTGRPVETPAAPFDFEGQSFLTAYSARQFGASPDISISFPRQLVLFALDEASSLPARQWVRASYDVDDGSSRWFGSIPLNPSTLGVARRGGPDLRRLLINCNPYLAMLGALLTSPSAGRPAPARLTSDMYGLRLWYRDRELGAPLEALSKLAEHIDLTPLDTVPHLRSRRVEEGHEPADDRDLARLLEQTGITRRVDTSLVLAPGVASEMRLPVGDSPTIWERIEPLRDDLLTALRTSSST